MAKNNWTRDQLLLAFNLYCRIPFGTIHRRNPKVIELAQQIGRTANAVSYKLSNFARLDPALKERGIKGATHGSHGEELIWEEFSRNPEAVAFESQQAMARLTGQDVTAFSEVATDDLPQEGKERQVLVRRRVNQHFFRKRVLGAYRGSCCITGLNIEPLLVASHIVPWAEAKEHRLNIRNGLCLNALHDRAFDRHLLWIEADWTIRISPRLREKPKRKPLLGADWLLSAEGTPLKLPKEFTPDPALLAQHRAKALRLLNT
jgi:putative restriction endonuclease